MSHAGTALTRWFTAVGMVAATAVLAPGGAMSAHASVSTFGPSGSIAVGDVAFTSTGLPTGESVPYPSAVSVAGTVGDVVDVNVTLTSVSHAFPADMDVVLVAPDGTAVTLMSDLGGTDPILAPGSTLVFDDEAPSTPPVGLPSGRYRPLDDDSSSTDLDDFSNTQSNAALSAFDGIPSANGTWALFAYDDDPLDDGAIGSWSLTVETGDLVIVASALAPTVTAPTNGALIASSTIPVRGTGSPGSTVFVRVDQQTARIVVVGPDGLWATDFTGLPEGEHLVASSATRTGFSATPVRVTLDSTRPTGTLTLRTVRGVPELTSSPRVYLVIAASERLRSIRVSNDGAPLGSAVPVTSSAAMTTNEVPWLLTDSGGSRRVFVELTDLTGNVSQGAISAAVTLDKVAPRVRLVSPAARARGVRRGKVITARFDDLVTPNPGVRLSYLARVYRVGATKAIRATVRFDAVTGTVRVIPRKSLRRFTRYRVVIASGFSDPAGNLNDQNAVKPGAQQMAWTFRTR